MIKKSFKRELLFSFIVVGLIPLILSGLLLIFVFDLQNRAENLKDANLALEKTRSVITECLSKTDDVMQAIADTKNIKDGIDETDRWERNKVYKTLYETTAGLRSSAYFKIYDAEGTCKYSTDETSENGKLPTYWGVLREAKIHSDKTVVLKGSDYLNDDATLELARGIFNDEDECLGYVVAEITREQLEQILSVSFDFSSGLSVLDSHFDEVYASTAAQGVHMSELVRERIFNGEALSQRGDRLFIVIEELDEYGLYIVAGRNNIFTADFKKSLLLVIVVLAAVSALICIFVARIVSKNLTKPVDNLVNAMNSTKGGNLDVNLSSKREDEFGLLSDTFDEMTKELKSYMELQVKQQKELNEANLEMMQAQLNPHFLYNTLDTMKWVAKANKVPVIADLSSDLAAILRTAISGGTFIKLSEELKLVDAYVNIQKIRFSDKFDYDVEVPMELEDMIVPKLIIQPIVENSIIHGFRDRASGQIFVNIYEEDGVLNIEVTDDGNGMTDEQLMIINAGEPLEDKDGKKKHIGIYNVSTILKLNYGKEYGLRAEAVSDGGTKTTIRIPAERERNV